MQGLTFEDESLAEQTLGEISYFRFAAYLRPMEEDKLTHKFKSGATFGNALSLYEFDTELRSLVFDAIQRIEIAIRTRIIQHFSISHGAFWYMDMTLCDNEHKFLENLTSIDREVQRSKEDFIKEHFKKYDKPEFPPAWKTMELASFGTLSKFYYNFSDKKTKKLIARQFNLPQHEVMESWMRSIAALRNYCAHHARLWNRYFNATPQLNVRLRGNWISYSSIDSNRLYAVLCCIAYLLESMGRGGSFKQRLKDLLVKYPNVDPCAMGFPRGWNTEPLWR